MSDPANEDELWPEPRVLPMPKADAARARLVEVNSNTVGAAGVLLADVAIGALVAVVLGALVGLLVAMLLLGLVLCRVAWELHCWELHDADQPDEIDRLLKNAS